MKTKIFLLCIALIVLCISRAFSYETCSTKKEESNILPHIQLHDTPIKDILVTMLADDLFIGYKNFYISNEVWRLDPKISYKSENVTLKQLKSDIVALFLEKGVVITFLPNGVISVTYNDALPWVQEKKEEGLKEER